MIRLANKFDIDAIVQHLKEFAIESKNPLTNNPLLWSKTHTEAILASIFAGQGFILIDEEKNGILVAVKTQCFWLKDVWQLQEVMLHSRSKILSARLVKEYVKISKEMLAKNEISQAVLASYLDCDYSRWGLSKFELHWEIK